MKVEVVTVKRKVWWTSDDQVVEAVMQEPSDKEDGSILKSDIGSTCLLAWTSSESSGGVGGPQ